MQRQQGKKESKEGEEDDDGEEGEETETTDEAERAKRLVVVNNKNARVMLMDMGVCELRSPSLSLSLLPPSIISSLVRVLFPLSSPFQRWLSSLSLSLSRSFDFSPLPLAHSEQVYSQPQLSALQELQAGEEYAEKRVERRRRVV